MPKVGVLSMFLLLISIAVLICTGVTQAEPEDFIQEEAYGQDEQAFEYAQEYEEDGRVGNEYYEDESSSDEYESDEGGDSSPEGDHKDIQSDEYRPEAYPDQDEDEIPEADYQSPDEGEVYPDESETPDNTRD